MCPVTFNPYDIPDQNIFNSKQVFGVKNHVTSDMRYHSHISGSARLNRFFLQKGPFMDGTLH